MNSLWSVTAESRPKSCSPKRGWPQVSEPVLLLAAEKPEVGSSQPRSETARESFDARPAPSLASKNLRCSLLPAELRKACSFGTTHSECRLTPVLSTARTTAATPVKPQILTLFRPGRELWGCSQVFFARERFVSYTLSSLCTVWAVSWTQKSGISYFLTKLHNAVCD